MSEIKIVVNLKCDLSKPIRRKIEIQWKKNQLNPTYLVREKSFRGNSIHEKARFTKYVESSEQNSSLTPILRRWCAFFGCLQSPWPEIKTGTAEAKGTPPNIKIFC